MLGVIPDAKVDAADILAEGADVGAGASVGFTVSSFVHDIPSELVRADIITLEIATVSPIELDYELVLLNLLSDVRVA
jgi:hypothetical protein